LNNALPTSNIRMRVFAAPLKGTAPNVSVVIGTEVGGGQLTLADNAAIQLAYVAIDASGEVRADNDAFTFKLPPDAKARVKQAGIRFLKRLNLPPGRYQLRVGVYDTGGDTVGTANYDLEVPDFNKLPFGMSGLFVTSKAATSTVTARADPELQKFLPAPPVSLREFPPGDDAAVTAEIYDRAGTTPHRVDIHTTVRSQDGKVVFEHSDERSSEELQGAAGGFVHRVDLPVGQLAPGTYLLTMEARSRLGQTVSRQFEFGVTSVP
jgi:hypothetical protein